MIQTADGTLWLGTKPDGLFRLTETGSGRFDISRPHDLSDAQIYHMVADGNGRLWVATFNHGLLYTTEPTAAEPRFTAPKNYPKDAGQSLRHLCLTHDGILLAAGTNGLLAARLQPHADQMHFFLHRREPDRSSGLSSSATMDVAETADGRLMISTESGGLNVTAAQDLLREQADFRHITAANHQLPTDFIVSQTVIDSTRVLLVSGHLLTLLHADGHLRVLDAHYFNDDYRFSEAHPLQLADGRWLFALNNGAFVTTAQAIDRQPYMPRLVLTQASIQGGNSIWSVESQDTLTLQPSGRSVTIHFAALDYQSPERIQYAFRLLSSGQQDTTQWNYLGRDRTATLLDLEPGDYQLDIRSTNADGEWLQNHRRLTIIVKPTFWESAVGRLLLVLIVVSFAAAVVYTLFYIRRIKRQQHETLEQYLRLIEVKDGVTATGEVQPQVSKQQPEDPMLQRIMKFVEENIGNSDVGVGDMAEAAATSRSGLQRKLKQTMGITPQDLMREARIKRACLLLDQQQMNISEVAYACGFTDPKYFSRAFKQSTGKTPTEYRGGSSPIPSE